MLRLCTPFARHYTTSLKPNIKLLAKLRQETEVSMSRAKDALVKNGNDYEKALAWLVQDAQVAGAKKAQKLADRTASEGVISVLSVNVPGPAPTGFKSKSTIVELNCETDFVSRNEVFKTLASRIAATSLLLPEVAHQKIEDIPVESLLHAPLMPMPDSASSEGEHRTVQESIIEAIGKLGENISLRRAAVVAQGVSAAYVHGGDAVTGKMAGLAVLEPKQVSANGLDEARCTALAKTARQVARQVVGYQPKYLNTEDIPAETLNNEANADEFVTAQVLSAQPFLTKPEMTVCEYVDQAAKDAGVESGAKVVDFLRWQVGEGIEKKATDFADEVKRTAQGN